MYLHRFSIFYVFVFGWIISQDGILHAAHIGLFASTGCYSHDVMMRFFADRLKSIDGGRHEVTLIQIRVYEFNRSVSAKHSDGPSIDHHLFFDARTNQSMTILRHLQRQMWTNFVPFDAANPLETEGTRILMQLHKYHTAACHDALRDQTFMEKSRGLKLDLLVTDYVLNECALLFSHLLDVNLAYFSNYPILSSYAVDLGISSNPSYVPSIIGSEMSSMNFYGRTYNSFLYYLLWSTRQLFDFDAHQTFEKALGSRFSLSEHRRVLIFSTPFEMMLDVARPVARNLHYFGCDHCYNDGTKGNSVSELLEISTSGNGIILVSFGTVTRGDLIPTYQLQRLIRVFAQFPTFDFVWQLDVKRDYFEQSILRPIDFSMPKNVHLFQWIPLKRLLADKRVILLISHGGVSTCSEALLGGVPILGIALQGDQIYNLQRIVDKGVAEMFPVSSLTDNMVFEKLSKMINEIDTYKKAASKLRTMMFDQKSLYKKGSPSTFWVGWTARHFGRSRNASNAALAAKRFLLLPFPSNWFIYYSLDVLLIPFSFVLLCAVAFCKGCNRLATRKLGEDRM